MVLKGDIRNIFLSFGNITLGAYNKGGNLNFSIRKGGSKMFLLRFLAKITDFL